MILGGRTLERRSGHRDGIFINECISVLIKEAPQPGTGAHTYNPSYLGGINTKDRGLGQPRKKCII
jgi:hypothetical protein